MSEFNITPIVFAAYREVLASMVLVAIVTTGCSSNGDGLVVTKGDIRQYLLPFLFLGFLCFINVACYILALNKVPSFNVAVFSTTQPIFATIIAYLCGYENMTVWKALSVSMTCLGAILTVWLSNVTVIASDSGVLVDEQLSSSQQQQQQHHLGNTLLLVSFFAGGLMWVVQKRLLMEIPSPITITAITYTIASVLTVTVALIVTPSVSDFYIKSLFVWAAIGYAVLFATVLNYSAMAWANQWANPSTVTLSLGLQPLLTALVNTLSGGPAFIPPHMLSCGLIVAGLGVKVYDEERKVNNNIMEHTTRRENLEEKQPLATRL
mmetsp:Transcript_20357/g.30225  ORF Transcript_20357/g.30225 Transcript_20357/m.30225 type:complete len:322 (-) Transcript_20357:289-1254(-)